MLTDNKYSTGFGAKNVFENSNCESVGDYFVSTDHLTGLAFSLDLKGPYIIYQFLLRNTQNGEYGLRYCPMT